MPKNAAGEHFSSKFKMSRHAKAHADEHEAKETPEFEAGEQEGMDEGPDEGDINQVVAEHGPAEEIHMEHDHAAGKHTVKSHHGGHVHTAVHASAKEAHDHAAQAAGVEPSAGEGMEGLGY